MTRGTTWGLRGVYISIHVFITKPSVTGSETIYGTRREKKRDWKHSPMNPASIKIYIKRIMAWMAMTTWSHSRTTLDLRELAGLCVWLRLFLDCIYICNSLCEHKICYATLDPVISSGKLAICRQIQTFTAAPEPPASILLHIPAVLCSLSRRQGSWISLPLQLGSGSPLNLTITDHLAWLHYRAMHVKSSHGPWPSHPISKYKPAPPPPLNLHLSLLLKFKLLLVS